MPPRLQSDLSDTTVDTPPLSPSSATRSSIASSNSSVSLGDMSSRVHNIRVGSRVVHEPTERVDPHSRKFAHNSVVFDGAREGDIQEEMNADLEWDPHSMGRGRRNEVYRDDPERTSQSRPQMPRQGSYSKRHSSFDTPREVPFPYGYLAHSNVPLPDASGPREEVGHERSRSVPLSPPGDPSRLTEETLNARDQSLALSRPVDDSVNGDSPPPLRPSLERSSSTSLPLPTSTPYFSLPPIDSSASRPLSGAVPAHPVIPPSSINTTGFVFSPPLVSPPRTTSLNPPVSKADPFKLCSPPRSVQSPRLPDSPPLIADEQELNEMARSTDLQPSILNNPSSQDARPHYSLPPPPKFMSSLSFTSPPALRPMSLPQPIENQPSSGSQSMSGGSSFPPPEPPTILTPPPPLSDAEAKERKPAPHEPFLPRDQPPPDHTYIAVETVPGEYRLIVRLPGFQRDSITLAMRRRRILHVVADNWSDDGGHFERRISFGYDADLTSIRAEFDGEILRIIVPRREPPGWFHQPTH